MLDSVQITRRQSEIRQTLAGLVGKEQPSEDEVRAIETLDREFRTNETRFRAALIAEDSERRDAKGELEARGGKEWGELVAGFEMRQVALALDEGRPLDGRTAEVVTELRTQGGFRGVPVPLQALELRAGETIAGGTPDPIQTRPIIDRLFPDSVAAKMGAQLISIESGAIEWPVATSGATAGWADGELANVAGPQVFATIDRALKPEQHLGVQMKISRKALKQSGAALEDAVRRDMNGAMGVALDAATFRGTGANGQPLGIIPGAATYGITATALDATLTYAAFLAEVVAFMGANLITSPGQIKALLRPELFGALEGTVNSVLQVSEYFRIASLIAGTPTPGIFPSNIVTSGNALAAPAGSPLETQMVLTTSTGGIAPVFVGIWGAVDLIRDPFSDAQSGGLRLTALTTVDVTVARPAQTRILTDVRLA